MYEQDWIMRQIQVLIQAIARLMFQKDAITYDIEDPVNKTDGDLLYEEIFRLLNIGKINEAENLLFAQAHPEDYVYMSIALAFYARLNEMPEEMLLSRNFSKEEIRQGLNDMVRLYGVDFKGIL